MPEPRYWLFKSRVSIDTFDSVMAENEGIKPWKGVRNARARNFIRDCMSPGDGILFYHSSTPTPMVVGTARVVSEPYPDDSAWDPASPFFDPGTDPHHPKWLMVNIQAELTFTRPVTLREMKEKPRLQGMMAVQPGNRLSIQPVSKADWDEIFALGMGE